MLLGHVEGSSALEQTYSHLFDDDYIHKAEEKLGYREKEERNPFTPETCPTCGELLGSDDKACSNCGNVFTPDAQSVQEQIEQETKESYREAGRAGDMEAFDDIEDVDELLENPAVKKALIEKLQED
jgi:methionyl-tRNA synthetase